MTTLKLLCAAFLFFCSLVVGLTPLVQDFGTQHQAFTPEASSTLTSISTGLSQP